MRSKMRGRAFTLIEVLVVIAVIALPAGIVAPDLYYTSTVGYGLGSNGLLFRQTRLSAFVDGYVAPLSGRAFPRALSAGNNAKQVREEDVYDQPTVYANPDRGFGNYLGDLSRRDGPPRPVRLPIFGAGMARL